MRTAVTGWLTLLALAAAGCGDRSDSTTPAAGSGTGSDELRGRTFTSTTVTENGAPQPLAEGTTLRLTFTDDGRLVANAGCNTIGGPAGLTGGKLTTSELSITEMGCDKPRHDQDQRIATFLGQAPAARLTGQTLVLSAGGTEITLAELTAAPLAGTVWTLDTLIQGQSAGSAPAGARATFTFDSSQVTVTGLCNVGLVPYQATDSTITFQLDPTTLKACSPDIMTLEQATTDLFAGPATYRLSGQNLTITRNGNGFRFTATKR